MSKFDWVELETLNGQFAHSQKRLAAARASQDHRLVKLLQQEITEVEERRDRVLTDLTTEIGVAPPHTPQPTHIPVEKLRHVEDKSESGAEDTAVILTPDPLKSPDRRIASTGDADMWDKLTKTDLERAKRILASRRSELLVRHTEEMKALEADENEVDAIERAIAAFAQKLKSSSSTQVLTLGRDQVVEPG